VVPASKALAQPRTSEGYADSATLEEMDWWEGTTLPPAYARRLEAILPWSMPSAAGWKVFGEEDGNRIDVIEERNRVVEVCARIDARNMDLEFLDRLVRFVDECGCVFLTSEGRILEPHLDAV
jgi:hypothetical protein